MRYLITGGAGFIGSHLAEALLEHGHEVHVYDNLSSGQLANIEYFFGHERFTSTVGDILNCETLEPALIRCDRVFHLAAVADIRTITEHSIQSFRTNVRGTENLLALAAKHRKKVLLASGGEVYGLSNTTRSGALVSESEDWRYALPTIHHWAVAGTKAADEYLALAYHHEEGLPVVIARLFNVVGPRQSSRQGALIPGLVKQAIQGVPMQVHGDGKQTRCFTYVADVVWGLRKLMETPEAVGGIYNLGSTEETTINGLVQKIRKMTGSSSEIGYVSNGDKDRLQSNGMYGVKPDIRAVRELIGYSPTYSLEEILVEIITDQPAPWTIFTS